MELLLADGLVGKKISVLSGGAESLLDSDVRSVVGTREQAECSNRGLCDYSTGVCECYGDYGDSDGAGGQGTLGDCGFQRHSVSNYTAFNSSEVVRTRCPFALDQVCSGNGSCDTVTGVCHCFSGYGEVPQRCSVHCDGCCC